MATSAPITRAYAPHKPTWQRFHEYAAPLASSSGAGSAAAASTSHNPYTRQYSHVYHARLSALRERCITNAKCALKDESMTEEVNVAEKIIEVKENVWSIIVGTIVKEVDPKRRPRVETKYNDAADAQSFLFPIDGTKKKKGEDEQESLKSFLFDTERGDVLHLEDESGRVELEPDSQDGACDDKMEDGSQQKKTNGFDPNRVATGVVAAVVGKVCATKGIMKVHSIHFAGAGTTNDNTKSSTELRGPTVVDNDKQDEEEPILLLVSGLECGSDSPTDAETGASLALRREMLLEYLTDPTLSNGASVCRVIVAGGGVSRPLKSTSEGEFDKENSKKKSYKANAAAGSAKSKSKFSDATQQMSFSLRELDLYLSELLSSGIPVDHVPGWHDPTNANWPQRPLHSCLLPLSSAYVDLFSRGTNPYEGILGGGDKENDGGVKVLGTDGLNIADLRRFLTKSEAKETSKDEDEKEGSDKVSASSCIDALNQTLNYGHMAPTGPDSLPTFPSSELDPFVINSKPSVYFAGNCDEFETRLVDVNGEEVSDGKADGRDVTRLVCVPSFALTGEVVLVKLKSLECEVVSFNDATL